MAACLPTPYGGPASSDASQRARSGRRPGPRLPEYARHRSRNGSTRHRRGLAGLGTQTRARRAGRTSPRPGGPGRAARLHHRPRPPTRPRCRVHRRQRRTRRTGRGHTGPGGQRRGRLRARRERPAGRTRPVGPAQDLRGRRMPLGVLRPFAQPVPNLVLDARLREPDKGEELAATHPGRGPGRSARHGRRGPVPPLNHPRHRAADIAQPSRSDRTRPGGAGAPFAPVNTLGAASVAGQSIPTRNSIAVVPVRNQNVVLVTPI